MGSYYYLAAQLPSLVYGQALPMSPASFKALAKDAMSTVDAAILDFCTLDPAPLAGSEEQPDLVSEGPGGAYAEDVLKTSSAFINCWKEWERTLRLNLARGRLQKLKREGGSVADAPDYPADAAALAKTAMAMESPLEAEIFLDKARWDAIDNFQGLDIFSENAMYAYLLKLLLIERRAAFKAEDGLTEYEALYTAILSQNT